MGSTLYGLTANTQMPHLCSPAFVYSSDDPRPVERPLGLAPRPGTISEVKGAKAHYDSAHLPDLITSWTLLILHSSIVRYICEACGSDEGYIIDERYESRRVPRDRWGGGEIQPSFIDPNIRMDDGGIY